MKATLADLIMHLARRKKPEWAFDYHERVSFIATRLPKAERYICSSEIVKILFGGVDIERQVGMMAVPVALSANRYDLDCRHPPIAWVERRTDVLNSDGFIIANNARVGCLLTDMPDGSVRFNSFFEDKDPKFAHPNFTILYQKGEISIGAPKGYPKDQYDAAVGDALNEAEIIADFFRLLNSPQVDGQKPFETERKSGQSYYSRGAIRSGLDFHLIKIALQQPRREPLGVPGKTGWHPRRHKVRGHWRHFVCQDGCAHQWIEVDDDRMRCIACRGLATWITAHERGDESLGQVDKIYEVRE